MPTEKGLIINTCIRISKEENWFLFIQDLYVLYHIAQIFCIRTSISCFYHALYCPGERCGPCAFCLVCQWKTLTEVAFIFREVSPYRNDTDKKCHYLQELDFFSFKFQLFPILTVNRRLVRSRRKMSYLTSRNHVTPILWLTRIQILARFKTCFNRIK